MTASFARKQMALPVSPYFYLRCLAPLMAHQYLYTDKTSITIDVVERDVCLKGGRISSELQVTSRESETTKTKHHRLVKKDRSWKKQFEVKN